MTKVTSHLKKRPAIYNKLLLFVLIFVSLNTISLVAQTKTLDPYSTISNYQNTLWNEISDTQIQRVFDIAQDSLGYIWLGCDKGLFRFDGTTLLPYTYKDYPVLKIDNVNFVEIGENGIIWLVNRRGVFYMKDHIIKEVKLNNQSIIKSNSVVLDKNQKLWITSFQGKIYSINNFQSEEIKPFEDRVYKVYSGQDRSVWVSSGFNNTMRLWQVNEAGEFIEKKMNGFIPGLYSNLSINKKGTIAIATSEGGIFEVKGSRIEQLLSQKNPKDIRPKIILDDNDDIWFSNQGLYRLSKGHLENFTEDDGLSNNSILSLLLDKDDNFWIGTSSGLNYLSKSPIKYIELPDKSLKISCLLEEDDSQSLLVGSGNKGLLRETNGVFYKINRLDKIGKQITTLSKTHKTNEYIIGSTKGLFRIKKENNAYRFINTYSNANVRLVYQQNNGNIWFSEIKPYGLRGKTRGTYVIIDGIKNRIKDLDGLIITSILEDHKGMVWVASNSGLYYKDSIDENLTFTKNELLESKLITNLVEDANLDLWVGTAGSGLVRIEKGSQIYFDTRKGLPVNQAIIHFPSYKKGLWYWVPDKDNGTLQKLIPENVNGEKSLFVNELFKIREGDSFSIVPGFPGIVRLKDSSFALAANNSVIKFDPLSIIKTEPVVSIEKIFVNGKEHTIDAFSRLEAKSSNFEFHYSSLDFAKREQQYFEYKLEGYDESWHQVGKRRKAYYSSLPAGDYSLRIRVKYIDKGYVEMQNPLQFIKKEFWYKTSLAYSLYVLSLLLIGVSIYGFRVGLLKKQRKKLLTEVAQKTSELKKLNLSLEQKVKERTHKISLINKDLTVSEERYKYALEASNDGIWDWDVKSDSIKFSPSIYTMLGYRPYDFEQSRDAIYNCIVDADKKIWHKNKHENSIQDADDSQILDEYRMKKKNGEIIWVLVKAKIVERNADGSPIRLVGTHTDITNEKRKAQELLEAVIKTENLERSRISRDIHDGLQQTLTISSMNFQSVKRELNTLSKKAIEKFEVGWKYLQESITESRAVAHTLMPKAILDFGVVSAFESLIDEVDKSSEHIKFNFHHNFENEKLENQQLEITLYRILQESINNIIKYSKASNVTIQLKDYSDIYMLTIEDDGVGFDLDKVKEKASGLGFQSMHNRLEAVNGFLEIDSYIGKGTSIIVEIDKNK